MSKSFDGQSMDSNLDIHSLASDLIGLESEKERIISFGFPKISDEEAIHNIKEILQNWHQEIHPASDSFNQEYCRGDLTEIEMKLLSKNDEIATLECAYARNTVMLTNFVKRLHEPNCVTYPFLNGVGIEHLVGKSGFLNHPLLKNEFQQIKRIMNDGSAVPFNYSPQG